MCTVSFKTLTSAKCAARVLSLSGIRSQTVSIDPALTKRGCSFGLSFDRRYEDHALGLFRKNGIDFGEVFVR